MRAEGGGSWRVVARGKRARQRRLGWQQCPARDAWGGAAVAGAQEGRCGQNDGEGSGAPVSAEREAERRKKKDGLVIFQKSRGLTVK